MSLREQLNAALITAMKAHQSNDVAVYRLIFSEIKSREIGGVEGKKTLVDAEILAVLEKMIKQRRESITQFTSANRQDLADKEIFELKLIEKYLPAQASEAEISSLIQKAIADIKAQKNDSSVGAQNMGAIIAMLRPQLAGRADMSKVSALVKAALN